MILLWTLTRPSKRCLVRGVGGHPKPSKGNTSTKSNLANYKDPTRHSFSGRKRENSTAVSAFDEPGWVEPSTSPSLQAGMIDQILEIFPR